MRALQRDQAQAVGEDFVLDYGGVVVDEDVFDGEGGDFGEQDAAEGVGDGGVEAGEGEGGVVGGVGVEGDVEVLGWLVSEDGVGLGRVEHTFLKCSRSHSWFSPGQWPGKSLDAWLLTISGPTTSFYVEFSILEIT